eukprot:COSAG04_NODE_21379_length_374_cov_1.356364_1_plen_59_part_10
MRGCEGVPVSLLDHGGLLRHLLLQLLTPLTLLLRTRLQHRTPHRSGQDEHGHEAGTSTG